MGKGECNKMCYNVIGFLLFNNYISFSESHEMYL